MKLLYILDSSHIEILLEQGKNNFPPDFNCGQLDKIIIGKTRLILIEFSQEGNACYFLLHIYHIKNMQAQ